MFELSGTESPLMKRLTGLSLGLLLTLLAGCDALNGPMSEAAQNGEQVFSQQCAQCHEIEYVAPDLAGIVGRKVSSTDFPYSSALRQADFVWDTAKLEAFLRAPRATLPGNQMVFYGISDDETVSDLIAYLEYISR